MWTAPFYSHDSDSLSALSTFILYHSWNVCLEFWKEHALCTINCKGLWNEWSNLPLLIWSDFADRIQAKSSSISRFYTESIKYTIFFSHIYQINKKNMHMLLVFNHVKIIKSINSCGQMLTSYSIIKCFRNLSFPIF